MKINKYLLFLALFLLFSFLIRIYKINNLSLFGDEIDVGYQAYSLLTNKQDYKGNFLPLYIHSLSESRAPLLIYTTVPSIALFGLNEFGVRFTPIFFGVFSIYIFYKLIFLLSKSHTLAIFSSIVMSLSPWHYHYSRTSFEVTLLITLILAGTYLFFKFIDTSKNIFLFFSIVLFCLSFYTYNTANVFVPFLIIFLFLTNFAKIKLKLNSKLVIFLSLIFLIIIFPIFYQILFGSAANRFNLISIFHNSQTVNNIITKRTSFSSISPSIEAFFHNKPIAYTQEFLKNYLSSFSLPFLFIYGDQTNLRHSLPGFGLIFLSFLPFLIIGLLSLNIKEKTNKLMLFWLLISPLASSLTNIGGNHATRLFLMLPALSFLIGNGILKFLNFHTKSSKIFLLFFSFTLVFETILYCHEYFVHYPKDSFEVWNYGYKQVFQDIPIQTSNRIFISNANYNSLLPFLFYQKYPLKKNIILDDHEIKNIYFINDWNNQSDKLKKISQIAQKGDIFILFQLKDIPGDLNFYKKPLTGFSTLKTIYNPNQTILVQIIQKQ